MTTATPDAVLERLKGLHPKVIDLALDRVERLLAALGHPERALPPVVHLAGTHGKGSTQATLRAMAEAAGQRVHAYTSPHLVRFSERIRVAGRIIDDAALTTLLEECEARNGGAPITFFEITTAAAFLAFARTPADLCLLETGLGGRVDATNVLERPALTVITALSLDHQAFLGETLAAIAAEKAGILKAGVPCVCAAQPPEAMAVIEARAQALQVPLYRQDRDWSVCETETGLLFTHRDERLALPPSALTGPHQVQNAGLAVMAARLLGLPAAALARGLRQVQWPARLQRLRHGPLAALLRPDQELWLDGGHNPAAGEALADFIRRTWSDRPVRAVVGMLNTKDSQGFLLPLARHLAEARTVTIPHEANSLEAGAVAATARAAGLKAHPAASVAEAAAQLAQAPGPARLLICGSLYLAGHVLAENG